MAVRYITPTGAGIGDGTSWANAGTLNNLNAFIAAVGPGGEILLRADGGAYSVGGVNYTTISHGGAAEAPVTVRGVDGAGAAMQATLVGPRADPWLPDLNNGGYEVFRLQSGADHLVFESLSFKNVGDGAFRIGADISDLTLQNIVAHNVQRFLADAAVASGGTASIDGLIVRDVEVHGFSKRVVDLRYDSRNILIEDVLGDSEGQDGDNFAMGVLLDGTVHAVVLRRAIMLNSHDSIHSYWNGDGFATEAGVYNVLFEDTYAAGNTDAGYDLKSKDTHLLGAVAEDNKRNFRFWSEGITVENSTSLDPHIRGGSGLQSHIWVAAGAHPSIINSFLSDQDSSTVVLDVDGYGASLSVAGTIIERGAESFFARLTVGSSLQINGVHYGADPTGAVVGSDAKDALVGTPEADELRGAGGDDLLNGRAGADILVGGDGADTVSYLTSPGGVTIDLRGGTGVGFHAEGDRLFAIENVVGSQGNDNLTGDTGANTLSGEEGSDTIEGGAGTDMLIGGPGVDTVMYAHSPSGVMVNLTTGTGSGGDAAGDVFSEFENLMGSEHADVLVGSAAANVIWGRAGDDVLYGLDGDDWLVGGAGRDVMVGGPGNDTYIVIDATDAPIEKAGEGWDRIYTSHSITLRANSFIELLAAQDRFAHTRLKLVGSNSGNVVEGNDGANILDGSDGADNLRGFRGNDTYVVDSRADRVFEDRGSGLDTVKTTVSYRLQPNSEVEVLRTFDLDRTASVRLTGNEFANALYGNAGRNQLAGREGGDLLRGLGGSDILDGGLGNDTLVGGPGRDAFVFRSALSASKNTDRVLDFRPIDDTIVLGHAVFLGIGPKGQLDPEAFHARPAAQDASDRIIYNQTTGTLLYDSDGSGVGNPIKFAVLTNKPLLSAADFVIG